MPTFRFCWHVIIDSLFVTCRGRADGSGQWEGIYGGFGFHREQYSKVKIGGYNFPVGISHAVKLDMWYCCCAWLFLFVLWQQQAMNCTCVTGCKRACMRRLLRRRGGTMRTLGGRQIMSPSSFNFSSCWPRRASCSQLLRGPRNCQERSKREFSDRQSFKLRGKSELLLFFRSDMHNEMICATDFVGLSCRRGVQAWQMRFPVI